MSKESILVVVCLGISAAAAFLYERRRFSSKELALIAALAALAALGRVPFSMLPSIQPTTFFVIISGIVFGEAIGLSIGVFAVLVSNVFLGHGPWTWFQMLAWGLCGLSAAVLSRTGLQKSRVALTAFGFVWGFLFGWMMNLWYWLTSVHPLNLSTWIATNSASFWFDAAHAVTNAVLLFVLGEEVIGILERFKRRLSFRYDSSCQSERVLPSCHSERILHPCHSEHREESHPQYDVGDEIPQGV